MRLGLFSKKTSEPMKNLKKAKFFAPFRTSLERTVFSATGLFSHYSLPHDGIAITRLSVFVGPVQEDLRDHCHKLAVALFDKN